MKYDITIHETISRLIDKLDSEEAIEAVAAVLNIQPWQAQMYVIGVLNIVDELEMIHVISRQSAEWSSRVWMSTEVDFDVVKSRFIGEITGSTDTPERVRLLDIPVPRGILAASSDRVDEWLANDRLDQLILRDIPPIIDVICGADRFRL